MEDPGTKKYSSNTKDFDLIGQTLILKPNLLWLKATPNPNLNNKLYIIIYNSVNNPLI